MVREGELIFCPRILPNGIDFTVNVFANDSGIGDECT